MAMHWKSQKEIKGLDAYFDWVLYVATQYDPVYRKYDENHGPIPVLIRLAENKTIKQFIEFLGSGVGIFNTGTGGSDAILKISPLYKGEKFLDFGTRHFAADSTLSNLKVLSEIRRKCPEEFHKYIKDITIGQILPADAQCEYEPPASVCKAPGSCTDQMPQPLKSPSTARRRVVTGIIDEGLAFANPRFLGDDYGTRIESIWLQDAACAPPNKDPEINYGRELRKECVDLNGICIPGIDALLRRNSRDGDLNEAAFYLDAGLIDYGRVGHKAAAQRISHGTHVMDLACGEDPADNVQDRPIIAVQLPSRTVADTSGIGLQKYMLDAVVYILKRAAELADGGPKPPVVINFSSGIRAGPHDGSSPLETGISELLETYRVGTGGQDAHIVLPAGNSHQARGHAVFDLGPKSRTRCLRWRVLPDDKTFSFVEIWLPRRGINPFKGFQLKVKPPGGPVMVDPLTDDQDRKAWELVRDGDVVCKVYYEDTDLKTEKSDAAGEKESEYNLISGRGRFVIALLPTAYHDAPTRLAPSGEWEINLTYAGDSDVRADAWIHWDESPVGYPRQGRQSYFDDPDYERFERPSGDEQQEDNNESIVRRQGTINALATGGLPVVVGGYQRKSKEVWPKRVPPMAVYTSSGPLPETRVGRRRHNLGPDAVAVSEESRVTLGVLAAGSRSGSTVAMNGTSVAAPQVTRFLVTELSESCIPTGTSAKDVVKARARNDEAGSTKSPPGFRIGYGRLKFDAHHKTPAQRRRRSME